MKRYVIIPGALLVSILFSAKSCDEDPEANRYREEKTLLEVMDSVKDEFSAEYLDQATVFVFTQKAKQKLRDYSDYMTLANDTSVDSAFRTQALAMSKNLFFRDSEICEPIPGLSMQIDSVWITQPLHMTGKERYTGELEFREKIFRKSGDDTSDTTLSMKKVEILVMKQNKLVGHSTLNVWQVYLGKITQQKSYMP